VSALRTRLAAALLAALALAAPSAPHAAPPADPRALIAQVLTAYGGRDALEKVHSYRMEGDLLNLHHNESSPTVRIFARPDRLKILIGYEGASEVRLVDGTKGWRSSGGDPLEPSEGPMLGAMLLQAARADVPWFLMENVTDARVIDPIERKGAQLLGLEFAMGFGLDFRVYVHPVTHRVVMSQGDLTHAGAYTHFETMYSDFRDVSGILFAFREENWASDVQTGVTTIRRIVANPKLRDGEFLPPALPGAKSTTG
jgi:hypothetical protein